MFTETDAAGAIGATAYDNTGTKIGKVGQVFLDDQTGTPDFLTVNTGLFGTSESFVPTQGASFDGDKVALAFTKDQVKDAPSIDVDAGHLDPSEESRLYDHYGLADGAGHTHDTHDDHDAQHAAPTGTDRTTPVAEFDGTDGTDGTDRTASEGHDTSGPTTDEAMTRSEEHLETGTERREAGRARLRKYVTTEEETVTVPVRKERAVLESEPITEANAGAAGSGPAISEEEHEVVLTEEHAVADVVAAPVERVRLGTETVVEDETVTEDVRTEQVEVDGDVERR